MSRWVEITTRRALPILIGCAQAGQTLSYRELDDEIVKRYPGTKPHIGRSTQWYAHVAGRIGDLLEVLSDELDEQVPPLNAIIVRKDTRLPSSGVDCYIRRYANRVLGKRVSEANRNEIAEVVIRAVYNYPKWNRIAQKSGVVPLKERLDEELSEGLHESKTLCKG